MRRHDHRVGLAAAGMAIFPWLPGVDSSTVGAANLGASYALVAISLVVLTGWVGQISLGHAAFVGIGAYATGWAAGGLGVPFPLSLPLGMAASAVGAVVLGMAALRVRGLFLAVASLIFSWMASEFLFRQEWLTRHYLIPDGVLGGAGTAPSFDFSSRRTFFYVAWALVAAAVFFAVNLRDSKTGRVFFAIRGSEMATASLGIDVARYKLLAFAMSGGLAGAAGNLMMSSSRVVTPEQFGFTVSLLFLSIAVVGGLRSVGGAVASALVFAALGELFFRVPRLAGYLEIVSASMLAVTLLAYPGGLAALGPALVARLERVRPRAIVLPAFRLGSTSGDGLARVLGGLRLRVMPRRTSSPKPQPVLSLAGEVGVRAPGERTSVSSEAARRPVVHRGPSWPDHRERTPLVEAEGITVRFGGLVAVDNASLCVREGEITGLIGPNGAGKTTLFNTVAGFVTPTHGSIRLFGDDVTHLSVHARARLGVARTFQAIQLFPRLTVFDNLLVATHLQNPTGVLAHLAVTADAVRHEAAARARVRQALASLDLASIADREVAGLPFGVLRMVELARAMATGFRVMMLDEPASGLDNSETDRLMEVVHLVRDLGVTVLLIEHDVRMVTEVSDYLYVLDQGRIIAEGTPLSVQRDPAVVAAYLGDRPADAVA